MPKHSMSAESVPGFNRFRKLFSAETVCYFIAAEAANDGDIERAKRYYKLMEHIHSLVDFPDINKITDNVIDVAHHSKVV